MISGVTLTGYDKVCRWTLGKYNFFTVYSITEHFGTKINLLPQCFTQGKCLLSFQRAALRVWILRGAGRGYMRVCFAPWHWSREWGHKACPHPPFVPLLSWQNPITTQCSNNRLQIRKKRRENNNAQVPWRESVFINPALQRMASKTFSGTFGVCDVCAHQLNGNEKYNFLSASHSCPWWPSPQLRNTKNTHR